MADFTIFKLKNLTPLHIGTGKENYDFSSDELSSDTISAALASVRAQQGMTDKIDTFLQSFTISSAFPFIGDVLFLPRPMGRLAISVKDMEEHQYRKELKKVKYIELSLWKDLVNGKHIIINHSQINKEFILPDSLDSVSSPSSKQVIQRVTINRDIQKTEPFFFEWQYFSPSSGLFFIINADKDVLEELFHLAISLGETGLGTDKNIGGGKFQVEQATISLSNASNPTDSMLLSTYIPTEEEMPLINLQTATYSILQRNGYIAGSEIDKFQHLRKKSIYMFNTGSSFKTLVPLEGKVVDLRPDWNDATLHSVFRSGKPFVIQIHKDVL